jgi:transposase, IS5 family
MKQISFATLAEAGKKRKTKRERFLEEMEQVVPWAKLIELIEPHYPKAGRGRRPRGLEILKFRRLRSPSPPSGRVENWRAQR